jgi:polyhydroxyalkanoate synthesis regulator phasin
VAKAVEERTAIVTEAEDLAASLDDSTNWRSTADKFRSLFEEWQNHQRTTVRIDKPEAEALWKRFSAARTTFNQARRKWAQTRDNERTQAKDAKEAIITEANELKASTAWGETSRKFNDLMDRWKKAGRAGRNEDDELWTRFREAADTFFDARQADRDQINTSEKENLTKKEELLTKAEALVPVSDEAQAKKARQELAKIQEEWDQIGYVPRDDMRRIESRLDAVDRQIKGIEDAAWKKTDPEADARKSSFEDQLNAQLAELDAKIAAESDPKKKSKLEAEKATKEQWLNAIK